MNIETKVQPAADGALGDDGEMFVFVPTRAYATRKTLAQGALDLALLMANASQLKALVDIPVNHRRSYYVGLIIMLAISILLQVVTGLLLLILGFSDPKSPRGHRRMENMNNASVCLILLITIVNVFISAFGISYVDTKTNP